MTIEDRKRALESFNFASIYFSFLLQRDDISIVMGYPPTFDRSPDGAVSINILLDQEITFINSGNRSAAFTYFAATAKVLERDQPALCNGQEMGDIYTLPVDLPNFILKAGEIKSVQVEVAKQAEIAVSKDIFSAKAGDNILICLHFNIVTPDSFLRIRTVLAFTVTFDKFSGQASTPKREPTSVLHERSVHFW
jgi:hypothetical protein